MEPVRDTGGKMVRKCSQCRAPLSRYNPGALCAACEKKESQKLTTGDSPTYDVNDMARILHLGNEQVRRLSQKGKLPPRVPEVRKCLWLKEVVDKWLKSGGPLAQGSAEQLAALAEAHGGWHLDKASGQCKLGEPEVVTPIVSDKSGSKMEIYTQFNPEHPESP
jgi:uncharacterized Zn finger protein (UPF0148 family)